VYKLLLIVLILITMSSMASATPLVQGTWNTFSWKYGLGPIDFPADGFDFTATMPVLLRVVDCCVLGDQFMVFLDGNVMGLTSPPINIGESGPFDPDSAWVMPELSKAVWTVEPGEHHVGLSLVQLAPGFREGAGWIRFDNVPEPGSIWFLGLGGGLILLSRKVLRR
jgi:hypothetical protein